MNVGIIHNELQNVPINNSYTSIPGNLVFCNTIGMLVILS